MLLVATIKRNYDAGRFFPAGARGLGSSTVHSVGAVPKSSGAIREIHALLDINKGIYYTSMYWSRVETVCKAMTKNCWFWRIDICDYYRNVEVDPADWELLAFRFKLAVGDPLSEFWDSRMEFGHRNSVEIAHRLTCAILAAMESKGVVNVTAILDDFIGAERTREAAEVAFKIAVGICKMLGFPLTYGPDKTHGPSQTTKWNGVFWDSRSMTVSVAKDKVEKFKVMISDTLTGGCSRNPTLTREVFETVRGRLVWAAGVRLVGIGNKVDFGQIRASPHN